MNAPIRRLSAVVALLFASLLVSTTLDPVRPGQELSERPDNRRTLLATYARERGADPRRRYPRGEVGAVRRRAEVRCAPTPRPVCTPTSPATTRSSTAPAAGSSTPRTRLLSGQSDKLFYRRVSDMFTGQHGRRRQPRAHDQPQGAAGGRRGPGQPARRRRGPRPQDRRDPGHGQPPGRTTPTPRQPRHQEGRGRLERSSTPTPPGPLVNRAIAGNLYPPGSTFKIVTAAAALSLRQVHRGHRDPRPGRPRPARHHRRPAQQQRAGLRPGQQVTTLKHALEISCNTAFGWLGMKLGAEASAPRPRSSASATRCRSPCGSRPSSVPAELNTPQLAQSAIGQYDVRVTPLQIAMVSAAVANRGVVMKPYLVKTRAQLRPRHRSRRPARRRLSQAVDAEVASALTRMMEAVVKSGTGPGRPDQRGQRRRQDRHRPARRRQGAARLVHRLRPGRRPQGRRGGRGRGRRQRRQRGRRGPGRRADREGRHGGGARTMNYEPGLLVADRYRLEEVIATGGMGQVWEPSTRPGPPGGRQGAAPRHRGRRGLRRAVPRRGPAQRGPAAPQHRHRVRLRRGCSTRHTS